MVHAPAPVTTNCTPATSRCACAIWPRSPGCHSPFTMRPCPRRRCPAWLRKRRRSGRGDSIRGRSRRAPRSRSTSARIDHNRKVSFYDRFELLELQRDDGIRTFQAREIATGRLVQAHLFVHAHAPESAALLQKLDVLPEEERGRIVDRGEHQGTPYVVTERLVDQPGLREWLVSKTKKPVLLPMEKKALDTAGAWRIVRPPAPAPAPSPEASLPEPSPRTLDEQFAELFETAELPTLRRDSPPPPATERTLEMPPPQASAPPAGAPAAGPGEFTRMFQSPTRTVSQPAPAPAGPAPGSTQSPGEFTRLFESPVAPGPLPRSPVIQQPLAPQTPGFSGPNRAGEFTQMFGRGSLPSAPPSTPSAPPPLPGGATNVFAAPRPAAPSPTFFVPQGPGEYTQMFAQPAPLTLGQPSAQPQTGQPNPPPRAAPARSYLPLILGLAAVLVLAIVIVVIFISMRPR